MPERHTIVRQVTGDDKNWAQRWFSKLAGGDQNAWGGLLLAMVPGLEHLQIQILNPRTLRPGMSYTDSACYLSRTTSGVTFKELFGWAQKKRAMNLQSIPGLKFLKHLGYTGAVFDWEWYSIPTLTSLDLVVNGPGPDLSDAALGGIDSSSTSDLSHVVMRATTGDAIDGLPDQIICGFLDHVLFDKLKSLTLNFSNFYSSAHALDEGDQDGRIMLQFPDETWDTIHSRISHLSKRLEHLRIDLCSDEDAAFLDFIAPFRTFTHFVHLTHLTLPQDAFIGSPRVIDLLPRLLQEFGIIFPEMNHDLCMWFEELIMYIPNSFPDFWIIAFYPDVRRGDSFHDLVTYDDPEFLVEAIQSVGFNFSIEGSSGILTDEDRKAMHRCAFAPLLLSP
jgi:hypothetical protein